MADKSLGKLTKVDLHEHWEGEAKNFTPWLALDENLESLSDALGMQLELVGTEVSVGNFRADIVCKGGYSELDTESDTESDTLVLIENQIKPTNHTHLGQLLVYASGLQAATIIWIASEFRRNIGQRSIG